MSSQYIIERFGRKVGLNAGDTNQRYIILDFINEALQTIYEYVDIPGSLVEEEFYVAGNQRIAMSRDVQSIRAMREKESKLPWKSQNLISEYNYNNWKSDSRCFRIVGYKPLKQSLKSAITSARGSNATGVTVKAHGQLSSETLHVTFETSQANSLSVLQHKVSSYNTTVGSHGLNSYELQLDNTNIISDIVNIRRFTATNERYGTSTAAEQIPGIFQVVDTADGTVYAEIPTGQSEASYLIVDVSEFPWDENSGQDDEHTLQVLYKKKLQYIQSDDDIFPLIGYENIIMHKAMQLFLEEQGKIQEALVFENKVNRDLGRKIADMERGQERKMQFGRHPHDNLTLGRRFHYHRG